MTTPRRTWPSMFRAGTAEGEDIPAAPRVSEAMADLRAPATNAVLLADVSEFQPDVNDAMYLAWSKAIVIRAAYGTSHDDHAWYGGQRRDLLHAGGVRFLGIYQYIVAGQDPVQQADVLGGLIGTLRPGEKIIGDFEEGTGNQAHRRDLWAARTGQLGDPPWTYSGLDYAAAHGLAPADWVAAYGQAEPGVPHKLWQFTDSFAVPGVGTADCSVYHGTIDQLAALAYQEATVPPTPPAAPGMQVTIPPPGTWHKDAKLVTIGLGPEGTAMWVTTTTDGKTWTAPAQL